MVIHIFQMGWNHLHPKTMNMEPMKFGHLQGVPQPDP